MSSSVSGYVMRCTALAGKHVGPGAGLAPVGQYLQAYNHDAHQGRGEADWTRDPAAALNFPDPGAAQAAWSGQSTLVPLRPDGKPNRPLTAYTIEVLPLRDAIVEYERSYLWKTN